MIKLDGVIHQLPRELKVTILIFICTLSIGFYSGLSFVRATTSMGAKGIETHYLGNEEDENAEIMKFKKNKQQMLSVVHNHILSLSVIFFLLAVILSITSIPKRVKYFLMIEPFVSVFLTFGGLYMLWSGFTWFKYIVIISGTLMTLSFVISTILIGQQLLFSKK